MDFDNSLDKIIPDVLEFVSFGGTALQIPSGTTAERPATPDVGATRLNTETGKVEIYNSGWTNIDTGGGSSNPDQRTIHQVGHNFSVGQYVVFSNVMYVTNTSYSFDGIVVEVIDADNFVLATDGVINCYSDLIPDTVYTTNPATGYLSPILSNSDDAIYAMMGFRLSVLYAESSTVGYIIPQKRNISMSMLGAGGITDNVDVSQKLYYLYDGGFYLASASSLATLASYVSLYSGETVSAAIKLGTLYIPYSANVIQLPQMELTASDGTNVYLSETPGEVTITPPAIKQVVGVIKDDTVCWIQPYREYNTPKITVATTSPSSPAVGDVWIDIS